MSVVATITERLKHGISPQDALLLLAREIDSLREASKNAPDPWLQPLRWQPPEDEEPALEQKTEREDGHSSIRTHPDAPLHGVMVGAVWRKLPSDSKAHGETSIVDVDQENKLVRFMLDRSWMKQSRRVSFTSLRKDWRLVRLPPDVYNVSAWVLGQLAEEPADVKELLSRGTGLCYKNKQITRVQIGAGISSLTKQGYVRKLDDGTSCAITDLGRAELRLRAIIVDLLREIGPLSVSEICRNLRTHFGNTANEGMVNRSLNSLECSKLVERYGTSWRASS